jgi:hypothetical protein
MPKPFEVAWQDVDISFDCLCLVAGISMERKSSHNAAPFLKGARLNNQSPFWPLLGPWLELRMRSLRGV